MELVLPVETLVEGHTGIDCKSLVVGKGLSTEDNISSGLEADSLGLDAVLRSLTSSRVLMDETLITTYEVLGEAVEGGLDLGSNVIGYLEEGSILLSVKLDILIGGVCGVSLLYPTEILDYVLLSGRYKCVDEYNDETGDDRHNENEGVLCYILTTDHINGVPYSSRRREIYHGSRS